MLPTGKQRLLNSLVRDCDHVIAEGAVSSGKTIGFMAAYPAYVRYLQMKYGNTFQCLISGRTVESAERNFIREVMREWNWRYDMRYVRGKLTINGIECDVLGANDEQSYTKLQGATYAVWYGNEITLHNPMFVKMGVTRMRHPRAKTMWDCNPDSPYHPIKTDYIDKCDGLAMASLHFELDDNPHLTKAYRDKLHSQHHGVFYDRYILGRWVLAEGVIYKVWSSSRNETSLFPENHSRTIVACDYGTSVDPCTFGKYYEYKGRWYKVDEIYYDPNDPVNGGEELTDDEYVAKFEGWLTESDRDMIETVVIDPSAASLRVALEKRGWHVTLADNDVLPGINTLGSMTKAGTFVVVRHNCPNTIRERGLYRWDEKAALLGVTRPLKKNDHTCDCDRYFAMYVSAPDDPQPTSIVSGTSSQTIDILRQLGAIRA